LLELIPIILPASSVDDNSIVIGGKNVAKADQDAPSKLPNLKKKKSSKVPVSPSTFDHNDGKTSDAESDPVIDNTRYTSQNQASTSLPNCLLGNNSIQISNTNSTTEKSPQVVISICIADRRDNVSINQEPICFSKNPVNLSSCICGNNNDSAPWDNKDTANTSSDVIKLRSKNLDSLEKNYTRTKAGKTKKKK
jgi:hypothetical protein